MNFELVAAGVQALMRAAQAGIDIYAERANDQAIFLPNLRLPAISKQEIITKFVLEHPEHKQEPIFAKYWDNDFSSWQSLDQVEIDQAMLFIFSASVKTDDSLQDKAIKMAIGGRMIEQWRADKQPPTVVARLALTLVDIGAEFLSSNPGVLGEQSRGEKLLVSFATHMGELIPNNVSDMGKRHDFESRVLGVFLRAGLSSLSADDSNYIEDQDVKALFKGIVLPIIEKLPDDLSKQIVYRDLVDTLIGPSAAAAFKLIANDTQAYLGNNFADEQALGAITQAFLNTAQKVTKTENIVAVFSQRGAVEMYRSALNVAVSRPELFIGQSKDTTDKIVSKLFSGAAKAFGKIDDKGKFGPNLTSSLAVLVIDTVGQHMPAKLKLSTDRPWNLVAMELIEDISTTLQEQIKNNQRINLFSPAQLNQLVAVVLDKVAANPHMLGVKDASVNAILAGVSALMAKDDNFLLSQDEWLLIAAEAANIAVVNPGRLFKLELDNQLQGLALSIIPPVLDVVKERWATGPHLLFGQTLASSLSIIIGAMGSNVSKALAEPQVVTLFISDLLEKAAQEPQKWGGDAILAYIQKNIHSVLAEGQLAA